MNDALRAEIVARFRGGASLRRIARELHVSYHSVRRTLREIEQARSGCPLPPPPPPRGSQLDTFEPAIRDLLARYPDITAQRVLEELRGHGYTGGYTVLSERVRQLRPRPAVAAVRRFETAPGLQAQMDYSTYDLDFSDEGRRRVHAFSYVLGYSRRQYLRFVEAQDFATTVREHIRAFEYLGGVAATCLYDNMKVVVSGYDGDLPVYNPRFLAICGPLRVPTDGLPRAAASDEGEGRAAVLVCGDEPVRRPDLPRPGPPERDRGLVADRGRRRARAPPDAGAADRPSCRGTPAPDPAPDAALRRLRGGVSHGRRRGLRGVPPELLRGPLAAVGPERRGARDRL